MSDQPNNALLVIDLEKRAVTKKIDLGESPEGVYISPDGKLIAAAVELTNSVAFIDTATDAVAFRVKIKGDNPEHAVFSPDGRFVYVSAEEDDKLEVIDVAARKLVAQHKMGTRPRGIAFTPDGAKAYVACERADTVYVFDARQHKILRTIKAGSRSNGLTMHPDGKRLYLTNGGAANVMVIDTATDNVVATIPVGQRPWNMALTKDGAKLYVANGRSDSVSVIDTAKNARIKDIPVETPWGVTILNEDPFPPRGKGSPPIGWRRPSPPDRVRLVSPESAAKDAGAHRLRQPPQVDRPHPGPSHPRARRLAPHSQGAATAFVATCVAARGGAHESFRALRMHADHADRGIPRLEFQQVRRQLLNAVLLPPWGVDDRRLYAIFNTTHVLTSYVFVALIAVHVLAALRHLFLRDGVFQRMWPYALSLSARRLALPGKRIRPLLDVNRARLRSLPPS